MADTLKCFHCGFPVAADKARYVTINGERRPVCCAGCEAVAGLTAGIPVETPVPDAWRVYDRAAVQKNLVRETPEGNREIAFIVEGIHCAACGLTIEKQLKQIDGVLDFDVNPTTRRARIAWQPNAVALSTIFARIDAIGYRPHPVSRGQIDDLATQEKRGAMKRIVVAGLGMMQVMTFAVAGYAGAWEGIDEPLARFLRIVSMLVATPVVLYSARPFFAGAWRDLKALRPGMDVPVALAIGGAFVASVAVTLVPTIDGDVYFDSVVMFTFFLSLGRYLEMVARHRTGHATDALAEMLPASVTKLVATDAGHVEVIIPLAEVAAGDRLLIKPGESVPADGVVILGESSADEAMLTGEATPKRKTAGDTLTGGSVNLTGALEMSVERTGPDTVLSEMVRLLERAQGERPPVARAADKVASFFVVGVLLMAGLVWFYWFKTQPASAFPIALSVLVVTCPCALSLATPAAITAATGRMAQLGLLVTRAHAIETLAKAQAAWFDKTGTLTEGRISIASVRTHGTIGKDDALAIAASLERGSAHPIAAAFRDVDTAYRAEAVNHEPGKGLEGTVSGKRYRIGTREFVAAFSGADSQAALESEATVVWLGDESAVYAEIELADSAKSDAALTIARLADLGLAATVVSGDGMKPVSSLANKLGIPGFYARQSPDQKLALIRGAQARGETVAMIGDGVNDAPVLAGADVSIAMGAGTALAQASADLVLLGDRLQPLADGIQLARKTGRVIRQNLTWAVGYNVLALPLAAAGYVAPWMAAIGMSLSSLIVVLNSLRLSKAAPRVEFNRHAKSINTVERTA